MFNKLHKLVFKSAALIFTGGVLLYFSQGLTSKDNSDMTTYDQMAQTQKLRKPANSYEEEYESDEYSSGEYKDEYQEPRSEGLNEASSSRQQGSNDSLYDNDEPIIENNEPLYNPDKTAPPVNQSFDEEEDELYDDYEENYQEVQQPESVPVSSSNRTNNEKEESPNYLRAMISCGVNCNSSNNLNSKCKYFVLSKGRSRG